VQVNLIKQMRWANPAKTYVVLVADTNEGENQEISTPYGPESIIWSAVQAYSTENIEEYVAPEPSPVQSLTPEQVLALIDALESKVPGIRDYISQNITQ
jgi:hypothetical protein